jgi:hypothetical protein
VKRHNPKTRNVRASTAARAILRLAYDYPGHGDVLDLHRVTIGEYAITTVNPRPTRRNSDVRAFLSSLERGDLTIMRAPLPDHIIAMARSKWISAKPYGYGGLEVKITKRGRDFLARIRADEDRVAARAQTRLFNPRRNPAEDPTQYVPFGESTLDAGYKIDGSKVKFWKGKTEAQAAAKALGWRAKDVIKVHTRFQIGWAIGDGRFGLLSKPWVEARLGAERRNPGCGCGGMRRNPGGCGCGGMRQNPADDRHYVVETRGKATKRHGPYPSRSLAESKARKLAAGGGMLAVVPATRTNGARRNSVRRPILESMIYAFDRI